MKLKETCQKTNECPHIFDTHAMTKRLLFFNVVIKSCFVELGSTPHFPSTIGKLL